MWVEMSKQLLNAPVFLSSSSWGCELKWWCNRFAYADKSHPLREDVSWNTNLGRTLSFTSCHPLREDVSWNDNVRTGRFWWSVILFVRMWVEMFWMRSKRQCIRSSSSWGCELKYEETTGRFIVVPSSSSWGCELKLQLSNTESCNLCHPLREDVSWNVCIFRKILISCRHPLREDVSWNIKPSCKKFR